MREPCCTVWVSAIGENDGHIPKGLIWGVVWLPHGYAPTTEDRLICVFPDPGDWTEKYSVKDGNLPPLVKAAVKAIEDHMLGFVA